MSQAPAIAAQNEGLRTRASSSHRIRLDIGGTIGIVLTILIVLTALIGPHITPHNPVKSSLADRLQPPVFVGGTAKYPLGTDPLGRDILSRIIVGSRVSLGIGLLSTTLAILIGLPIGLISGFYRGRIDDVAMRIADIQLAFPAILLALAILAVLGPSTVNLIIVLSLAYWVPFARVVRGEILSLMQNDFIAAAYAIGAKPMRVMLRHLLPNLVSSLTVLYTVSLTRLIIAESSLSFLGFGVQPPTPSWGGMLGAGRDYLAQAWWVATLPGVALLISVLGINLVGDWIRDRLDPRIGSV